MRLPPPLAVNVASHDFVKMEDGFLWADRGLTGIERMSKTAPFVHPVKLAIAEQAMLWVCFILYTTIVEFKAIYIYRGFQQKKIANYPIVVKKTCFSPCININVFLVNLAICLCIAYQEH